MSQPTHVLSPRKILIGGEWVDARATPPCRPSVFPMRRAEDCGRFLPMN
jgi:hypothetical protein